MKYDLVGADLTQGIFIYWFYFIFLFFCSGGGGGWQVKELSQYLEAERSSRTDLEMYVAVLNTQKGLSILLCS